MVFTLGRLRRRTISALEREEGGYRRVEETARGQIFFLRDIISSVLRKISPVLEMIAPTRMQFCFNLFQNRPTQDNRIESKEKLLSKRSSEKNATITRVLQGAAYGPEAVRDVLPLVYAELKRLANGFLRYERKEHTLMATDLVHEAYVKLFGFDKISFKNRRHFFAMAAMAMRRILVEHHRRRVAGNRIPPDRMVPLEKSPEPFVPQPNLDLEALNAALTELEEVCPRQARAIELNYFAGLTEHQIAEVLEVSRPTVSRDLKTAKLWLFRQIGDRGVL